MLCKCVNFEYIIRKLIYELIKNINKEYIVRLNIKYTFRE